MEVMRLKFDKNDPLDIRISQKGILKRHRIAPLILLPFVENAFKHGLTAKGEGYVIIDISKKDNYFRFTIENSLQRGRKGFRKHPGIGLDNVKKRLQLLYSGKHQLDISDSDGVFKVQLTIILEG